MFWWISSVIATIAVLYFAIDRKERDFKGKSVVITGASSGIGEQIALQLAAKGAWLVLGARRIDKLNELVKRCTELGKSLGGQAIAVQMDVTNDLDCKNAIETAVREFGGLDMLVLNAGQGCLLKVNEIKDLAPLRNTMDTNFWGYIQPIIHALPHLRSSRGIILAVSSLAAKIPTPRRSIYGASKAAVESFLNSLRSEEPHVQVTIVCPGFVLSEFHERAHTDGNLQREVKHFMTTETAAQIILKAAAKGKREDTGLGFEDYRLLTNI